MKYTSLNSFNPMEEICACISVRQTIQWLKEKGQTMIYKILHRTQKIEQLKTVDEFNFRIKQEYTKGLFSIHLKTYYYYYYRRQQTILRHRYRQCVNF